MNFTRIMMSSKRGSVISVILTEASNASAGKDLGQLRASEAGTGFESLRPTLFFRPAFGDDLFSLPPADFACYAYAMVNRQDIPHSPGSPEIGRHQFPAEIIFDGTKLPVDRSRPKTTTDGINCSF